MTIIRLEKVAEFYKALGDETRLTIVNLLSEKEMCVCEIIDHLGLSQPAVSHHLKILKHAGILKDSKEGKWIYYSLNPEVFKTVFTGDDQELIQSYAAPLKTSLEKLALSEIRKDPGLCEKLMSKQSDN